MGLALTGTIFATTLAEQVPARIGAADVPPEVGQALARGGGLDALTGVGDLGAALLASVPAEARAVVEPYVPAIVGAIHEAFSIATSNTFLLGIGATAVAAGLVLLLREAPARASEPGVRRASPDRGANAGDVIRGPASYGRWPGSHGAARHRSRPVDQPRPRSRRSPEGRSSAAWSARGRTA